jgi:hypothetical protein
MNTPKATKTANATHPIPMPAFAPAERLVEFDGIGGLVLVAGLAVVVVSGGIVEVCSMAVDIIGGGEDVGVVLVEAASCKITKLGLVEFGGLAKLSFWLDAMKEN